ncbi:MAG: pilus assembly protein CpaE, partial [Alphaproteobacteria bacterium]|nr:pilus assembly protein CpaE [Alphaproteobacteria bacterium]
MSAATEVQWPDALIEPGGVEAAAAYLVDALPPDVLVIDLGDSEQPYEDLMGLSEVCHPDTQVVAIGKVNDLAVYRRIVGAGVVDYLVKPVIQEDLETALTEASERQPEVVSPSGDAPKTVLVIGSRGGVGATTVAANGAWLSAETMGKKTVLLDLDVQFGTSALSMDVLPAGGLVEALQHPSRVDSLFMASALTPKT